MEQANKASAEKAVHDELRALVERIRAEHGVYLLSARFSWVDVSTVAEQKMLLTDIEVETKTKGDH